MGLGLLVAVTLVLAPGAGGARATPTGRGYWLAAADGGVFAFGDATFLGSMGGLALNRPIVAMAATPTGQGYWLAAADGGVFAFGDATFLGSMGGLALNRPIVAMAATPTGQGYWLAAADGGVFAFGDAAFYGSVTMGLEQGQLISAMAATRSGNGYWLVDDRGEVFPFGDARNFGQLNSAEALPAHLAVTGIDGAPDDRGYLEVEGDGQVVALGNAQGAHGPPPLNALIVAISVSSSGNGHWLAAADGGVFAFGDAAFWGSMGGMPLNQPIVGMATLGT